MIYKPEFVWNEEDGMAICILTDPNKQEFVATAQCDEEDQDMKSEKTGCQIALFRAEIKYFIHLRDNEIKPQLKSLNTLYYNMKHSKKFNPNSYENKMLQRMIHQKENDLDLVKYMLAQKKKELKGYLDAKQEFYNHIRRNRKADLVGQKPII